jgi:hypothetical protein
MGKLHSATSEHGYCNIAKICIATSKNMYCNIKNYVLQYRKNIYCNIEKTSNATSKNMYYNIEKLCAATSKFSKADKLERIVVWKPNKEDEVFLVSNKQFSHFHMPLTQSIFSSKQSN